MREAHDLMFLFCPLDGSREYLFSTPLKALTLRTPSLSIMATFLTSLNTGLITNCSVLSYTFFPLLFLLVKYSCCSAVRVKRPSSYLFVLLHSTLSTTAAPPSCLNVLSYVSMWMASSCFRKTLSCNRGWVSYELPPHARPIPFAGPDVHAQINTLVPLFLHNDFTHPWPCSNEVWRFYDATGKSTRGTLLSILVHLSQFFPAWAHLRPLSTPWFMFIWAKKQQKIQTEQNCNVSSSS